MSRRFLEAVRNARLSQLKALCQADPDVLNYMTENGETALIESLKIGDDRKRWKIFKFLLKNGVSPYKRDKKHNRDALHWAIYLSREQEALLLLSDKLNEFNTTHFDNDHMTPLHYAVQNKLSVVLVEMCKQNQRYNETVDVKNNLGLTPYLLAVKLGYSDIVDLLIQHGASQYQGHSGTCRCLRMFEQSAKRERQRIKKEANLQHVIQLKIQGRLPLVYGSLRRSDEMIHRTDLKSNKLKIIQSHDLSTLNSIQSVRVSSEQVEEIPRSLKGRRQSDDLQERQNYLEDLPGSLKGALSLPTGINRLLSLKEDGSYCDRYVRSVAAETLQDENELNKSLSTSMNDITTIFHAVSERMTKAYCSGAKKLEPVKQKERVGITVPKTSTLAAIMADSKPRAARRRKMKRVPV